MENIYIYIQAGECVGVAPVARTAPDPESQGLERLYCGFSFKEKTPTTNIMGGESIQCSRFSRENPAAQPAGRGNRPRRVFRDGEDTLWGGKYVAIWTGAACLPRSAFFKILVLFYLKIEVLQYFNFHVFLIIEVLQNFNFLFFVIF